MAIYYHISNNLEHNGKFHVQIPRCKHQLKEDTNTKRICVSKTIDGCFTSIPEGGCDLDETNSSREGIYKLFTIDTDKLGLNEDDIIDSSVLFEKDLVRDADFTDECWILKDFEISEEDCELIKLIHWNESVVDDIPHYIFEIAEEKYEGDYLEAYIEETGENIPCSIEIENVEYITSKQKSGAIIEMKLSEMDLNEYNIKLIKEAVSSLEGKVTIENLDKSTNKFYLRINDNVDISPVFTAIYKNSEYFNSEYLNCDYYNKIYGVS